MRSRIVRINSSTATVIASEAAFKIQFQAKILKYNKSTGRSRSFNSFVPSNKNDAIAKKK